MFSKIKNIFKRAFKREKKRKRKKKENILIIVNANTNLKKEKCSTKFLNILFKHNNIKT